MVKVQNLNLAEEKATLEKENQKLQNMIRQYCNQQAHGRVIDSLRIPNKPTVVRVPTQEAAHMKQLTKQHR